MLILSRRLKQPPISAGIALERLSWTCCVGLYDAPGRSMFSTSMLTRYSLYSWAAGSMLG
jgi:hypothetical protein